MHKITIIGLEGNIELLYGLADKKIILRTKICEQAEVLNNKGIQYSTLDNIYDNAEDFDNLDKLLADEIISQAKNKDVIYAVPGSAVSLDGSVAEIIKRFNNIEIIPGKATEYDILSKNNTADASCGYSVIPAACLRAGEFSSRLPLIVTALDNELLLSDVKLILSEEYGDEHEIIIGDKNNEYKKMLMYELDRYKNCDHNTVMYISRKTNNARYDLQELEEIFKTLRSPEGCPWDREQTHMSLRRYLMEECAETVDAIDSGDMKQLLDELGDVLLQVLFHAIIASERGDFDMRDVCDNLARKIIKRHPHVFSEAKADNPDEVKQLWDEIKHNDKQDKTHTAKLNDVPKSMTALMKAQKVLSRALKADFIDSKEKLSEIKDTKKTIEAIKLLTEKLETTAINRDIANIEEILGSLLFYLANMARIMEIEAELSLNNTIKKYIKEFEEAEINYEKALKSVEWQE